MQTAVQTLNWAWLKSLGQRVTTFIGVGVASGIGIGSGVKNFDSDSDTNPDADCYPTLNHALNCARPGKYDANSAGDK